MQKELRLIGGSHAGKTHVIDAHLPIFKLPVKRKLDLSIYRADAPVMPISVKLDLYTVRNWGGDVLYGIHESLRDSEALYAMWYAYSDKARKDQKR